MVAADKEQAGQPGRPKALLFDWDNTLVDTWDIIHHALRQTFLALGREPWTPKETRARVRASARDSFPALFGAHAEEAANIFYRCFEEEHLDWLNMRAGAAALLARLDAAGYLLSVVSNKRGDILRREAEALGWSGHFHRLVGALDAAADKPAPAAVTLALDGSGIAPGPDVWFVGDTDIDLLCAVNAGCLPVLLRPDPPGPEEFPGHEPQLHVHSCLELADILVPDEGP